MALGCALATSSLSLTAREDVVVLLWMRNSPARETTTSSLPLFSEAQPLE